MRGFDKMGRKYYCEYCDKRFKDDPNIRKKHIEGLPHQKARIEHYAHFKSPKEILEQEQKKKPCAKFPSGTCQFGATCRFSHYTSVQLAKIRQQAHVEEEKRLERLRPKTYSKQLIVDFERKRKLEEERSEQKLLEEIFNYPREWLKIQHELPPLRLIHPEILKQNLQPNHFG